jgi:hypothetical protein
VKVLLEEMEIPRVKIGDSEERRWKSVTVKNNDGNW